MSYRVYSSFHGPQGPKCFRQHQPSKYAFKKPEFSEIFLNFHFILYLLQYPKSPPHIFFLKVFLKHQWFGAYTFYPLLDLCLFLSLHMKHPQTQSHLGSEPRLDWPLSRELHSLPNSSSLPEA